MTTARVKEYQQLLLDQELANPKKRLNKDEKRLLTIAKERGMTGQAMIVQQAARRAPQTRRTATTATTATTAVATTTRAPRATATKAKSTATSTGRATATRKRKGDGDGDPPPSKKTRAAPRASRKVKIVINQAPTTKLNVFVFGEGSSGELGLGSVGNITDVKRPRLNANLSAAEVGVVQLAVGGMHVAALTHDNKILTWGVNDQGALGRDTTHEAKTKDADVDDESDDESDDDEAGLAINPRESTPTFVDMSAFPEGTVITQVAAGDSVTMALTDEGLVYGCGTFRNNEGILGFSPDSIVQDRFTRVFELTKITRLECGDNHVLALNDKGVVKAWGSGQQNQLGRRVLENHNLNGLVPRSVGLKEKIAYIVCGAYHSFAVATTGNVWSWGLNSYGETGIADDVNEDTSVILAPKVVRGLIGKNITCMAAGAHHSIAVAADGKCFTWGRLDGCQTGLKVATLPEDDVIKDDKGNSRILKVPTELTDAGKVVYATAGTDTSIVVNADGKAYSWGFSGTYQTGLGTSEDVEYPTIIENTAVKEKHLVWAGAGGQFGMLAAPAPEE